MTSFATVTPGNMELTPCRVTYGGVDLGGTLGNVTVKPKYGKADIMADQFGKSVLDRVVSSIECTIEFEIAEVLKPENWKVVFPNADLITSGMNKAIVWRSKIGSHDLSLAQQLRLHPLSLGDGDVSSDMTFFKAVSTEDSQYVFDPSKQSSLKLIMAVYLDTSVQPARLWVRGDPTILPVAASVGAPVFSGTGNGTLTALAAGAKTITETITFACVGVPAANKSNWYVSGSLSGSIGMVDITSGAPGGSANFSFPEISGTITDGSTDFVVGDQFTVATTAPNYV